MGFVQHDFHARNHGGCLGAGNSRREIMDAFAKRFELHVETVSTADESVFFPLPVSCVRARQTGINQRFSTSIPKALETMTASN